MRDHLHAFRLALRALGRTPAFTLAAVGALALGIGGSTVVFSVVDTLLLRPLPYAEPERLVLAEMGPPWALYEQWRAADVFEGMAAYNERAANVTGAGEPERIVMARVTPNFLSVVGVNPRIGHGFGRQQSEPGGDRVVLLTDAFWRKHFGGSPGAIGRTLTLDDQAYTVIGVLPRTFQTPMQLMPARGLSFDWGAAVLVPLVSDPLRLREPTSTDRFWRGLNVIARLRRGVTVERARAAAATMAAGVTLPPYLKREYRIVALTEFVAGDLPSQMAILVAAVGLLLLVACGNVANLVLARGAARRREMVTRAALGASARHLVGHALTETVTLGALGGVLGALTAWGGVKAVSVFGGPVLGRLDGVGLDLRVLAFAAALSLGVGLLVGLLPAVRLAGADPASALRVTRGYAPDRSGRLAVSSLLVVVEVVLSLVLIVGAGLLARDLSGLLSADLGFRSEGVLTADVSLSRTRYPKRPQVNAFFEDLLTRAAALPSVQSVALSSVAPAGSAVMSMNMRVEGATRGPNAGAVDALAPETHELVEAVGGNYFRTLSMPILEGRGLNERDTAATERVVVVNRALALKYWESPRASINRRVQIGDDFYRIVGVAEELRHPGPPSKTRLTLIYIPLPQTPGSFSQMTLLLKGRGDAAALAAPLAGLMRQINPNQPLYNVLTLDRIVSTQLARRRLIMTMMAVFAALALLLAAVGIYGVMSYAVVQRAHELGVRMAIGGSRRDVFSLVLLRGMRLVGLGVVVGLPLAYALTRVLAAQLVGVTRTDVPTYVAMTGLVVALGLIGCAAPAWRATRVDPIVTLRAE
jgi:predicted permease